MTSKCQIVPPDDLRCIWMSAGILSYQLCDRQLDCDTCPLDAAMRKRHSQHASLALAESVPSSPEGLRNDRIYSPNHCWVKEIHDIIVRVGIEPGFGKVILNPKTVVLPAEGQRIDRGQTCAWIVMQGGTLPVGSPVTGVVRDTNRTLSEKPYLLRTDPLDHGWFCDMELDSPDKDLGLLTVDKADAKYRDDEASFSTLVGNSFERGRADVGITLADGGQRLQSAAEILGPSKYFALLRRVYG